MPDQNQNPAAKVCVHVDSGRASPAAPSDLAKDSLSLSALRAVARGWVPGFPEESGQQRDIR